VTAEPAPLVFRELRTAKELGVLPEFEKRIWGGESEMVSVNVLVATVSEGGMAIGAFAGDGLGGDLLVGAVYGFATAEPGVLHSHYMAVDPAYRRSGLAVELKQRQRAWCIERGLTCVRWTFDPLQLANAHLNLNRLGAVGISYHLDLYGTLGGINGSLPSDRVTVRWDLHAAGAPSGNDATGAELGGGGVVDVDVPPITAEDIAASTPAAHAARLAVRDALAPRLGSGWVLTGIDLPNRRYRLTRP
jgi:predicted GNAT superfamily acetyltransferase